jgi:hypothetical protein
MGPLAPYQLWIGFGFAAFVVLFLVVAFFTKKVLSDDQRKIMQFLCALCAGCSGWFITGSAFFEMSGQVSDKVKFTVSGTAGVALFFAVLFLFKWAATKPPDAFHFSVPGGWTFQKTVDTLVQHDNAVAEFLGFTPDELRTPLHARELQTKTVIAALRALRHAADRGAVREYDVEFVAPIYRLRVHV